MDINYTLYIRRKGTKSILKVNVISERILTEQDLQSLIGQPRSWLQVRRALFAEFGWMQDYTGKHFGDALPVTIQFAKDAEPSALGTVYIED